MNTIYTEAARIYSECCDMDAADYAETMETDIADIVDYIRRDGVDAARKHFLSIVYEED